MISAVIPTLRGRERLERNLGSVAQSLASAGDAWEILVVDDGGGDLGASVAGVQVVRLEATGGYGPAVNAGVAQARGDYLLVLNDDVRLEQSAVRNLRSQFPDSTLFAVVPAIRSPFSACGDEGAKRVRWQAGLLEFEDAAREEVHPTPYPVGCCFLCTRAAFLDLGGFDDAFAPYFFEDTDLGFRAWRRGLRVLHVPSAVCHHEGSATLRSMVGEAERDRVFTRNRLLFHLLNLTDAGRRSQFLGSCAALALFEPRPGRRAALAEALQAYARRRRHPSAGLSDSEVMRRMGAA